MAEQEFEGGRVDAEFGGQEVDRGGGSQAIGKAEGHRDPQCHRGCQPCHFPEFVHVVSHVNPHCHHGQLDFGTH
ncbi:hypothetical protein GCM10010178_41650 [Lentzea flava]|uniref:Uncharacterized protein n=1 Tax=Lentzea flava TaxID=103732 RepID=A0ABQ2UMH9_9PSEU|nr:hypothetical protein GCM10010178_41650 [Lentzea flava]